MDSFLDGSTVGLNTISEVVGAYQAADTTVLNALNTNLALYVKTEDFEESIIDMVDEYKAADTKFLNALDTKLVLYTKNEDLTGAVINITTQEYGDHNTAGYAKQTDLDLILAGSSVDLNTLSEIVEAYQSADTTVLDALNTKLELYTKNEDLIDVVDVKIGDGASVGSKGVAIGRYAGSLGNYSIAVGFNSQAGTKSIAIGGDTETLSNSCVRIGHGSKSYGNAGLAVGYLAQAGLTGTSNQSIAIGPNSIAKGHQSICVGTNSEIPDSVTLTTVIGSNFTSAVNSNAFYVTPIRADATPLNILYYDNTTKEITYGINTGSDVEKALTADHIAMKEAISVAQARIAFNAADIAVNLAKLRQIEDRMLALETSFTQQFPFVPTL